MYALVVHRSYARWWIVLAPKLWIVEFCGYTQLEKSDEYAYQFQTDPLPLTVIHTQQTLVMSLKVCGDEIFEYCQQCRKPSEPSPCWLMVHQAHATQYVISTTRVCVHNNDTIVHSIQVSMYMYLLNSMCRFQCIRRACVVSAHTYACMSTYYTSYKYYQGYTTPVTTHKCVHMHSSYASI